MTAPLDDILAVLTRLVAIDTTNPPRRITADGSLCRLLQDVLPGFEIEVTDYGSGSIVFDAVRGAPDILFNVHLDTVPVAEGWEGDPFELRVGPDRATGLGACDIKGAAACLIAVSQHSDAPMRLVLTTDEEAGKSTCIREFLKSPPAVQQAIVAEPTLGKAVLQHRGIFSAMMKFSGESGHSSGSGKSAVHDAARWITSSLEVPAAAENRFNVGRMEGGVKANMIAASAELLFGFRNVPGTDRKEIFQNQFDTELAGQTTVRFDGPALPNSSDGPSAEAQSTARIWAEKNSLPIGEPVDFFTEAAFFAEAGIPALVLGPGSIEQAHTANEWVALKQLEEVYSLYERIIKHG
ncbi:MAG: acetylornithine deacetylase [Parvularcula sp.]